MSAPKLLRKKELWLPTWQGWMLILAGVCALVAGYMFNICPFLCVTRPVRAQILAVEGWIPPNAFRGAASEFKTHGYKLFAVVGDERYWVVPLLQSEGIPRKLIIDIASRSPRINRTFASALAFRDWLIGSKMSGEAVNVFTMGAHARRSWLLFRKALGPRFKVGIISFENPGYNPGRWWRSSVGLRRVLDETLAYIYTEFYFLPSRSL